MSLPVRGERLDSGRERAAWEKSAPLDGIVDMAGGEVTIIHSADFHLGRGYSRRFAKRARLGEKTAEHHRLLLEAFERVAQIATEEADVWLIAGDLLDAAPIETGVTGGLAERVTEAISKALDDAPRLHVVLIAGNHDQDVEYDRGVWGALAAQDRVRIVTEPQIVSLDGPGINVVALPWMGASSVQWRDWPASGPTIAAAHCCFPETHAGPQDFVLTRHEVAGWPVNYVALGHYHSGPYDVVEDRQVVYAGAPEIIDVGDLGQGRVVRVRVGSDGSASWEPVPTGELTGLGSQEWRYEELPEPKLGKLGDRLKDLARQNKNAWVRVRLTGRRSSVVPLDLEGVLEDCANQFFLLELLDETEPAVDVDDLRAGENETVLKHFLEIGHKELADAKARLERARAAGDKDAEANAQAEVDVIRQALLEGYSVLSSAREQQ